MRFIIYLLRDNTSTANCRYNTPQSRDQYHLDSVTVRESIPNTAAKTVLNALLLHKGEQKGHCTFSWR